MGLNRILSLALAAALAAPLLSTGAARAQSDGDPSVSIELVDPKVLRVCADPNNLPFSNEKGEGYENKLAEFLAKKLGKSLAYTFYPGATGFVRLTLMSHKCDIIMGFPQGDDLVQPTNPYYRTAYALIFKPGSGFEGIESLDDPHLQGKRFGIVARTPPATNLAVNGLIGAAKPYPLVVDTRFDSSTEAMFKDLVSGEIDIGVLWGPIAGNFARRSTPPMVVVPLVKEKSGPKMAYRMVMGVRASDQDWKRLLNKTIAENQGEITKLLLDFGVPLLDDNDKPITN